MSESLGTASSGRVVAAMTALGASDYSPGSYSAW